MAQNLLTLPKHLQDRVRSELKPGEAPAWVGQPDPSRFMKTGFLAWAFFIPWTAFSLFWMAGASGFRMPDLSRGAWNLFPLFGLPFLLIGLGGLSSPYWMRRKAANTVYVITNQRAFLLEGARSFTVRSFTPQQLANVIRKEHPDGSGDLVFAVTQHTDSDGDARKREHGFFAVPAVREVERRIEALARVPA